MPEPYAQNPAPNRILSKVGFELIKTYDTTPGWISLHQTVNLWELSRSHPTPVFLAVRRTAELPLRGAMSSR